MGLLPLQGYTVTVIGNCGGGLTSTAVTVSFVTGNGNDEPCTATPIALSGATCLAPTNSTIDGATATPANGYAQLGCGFVTNTPDVWFSFTTAATGAASTGATITASGQAARQLRLFAATSCNGPFTELACSITQSPGSNPAPVLAVAGLLPSTTYYLRVAGSPNGAGGQFTVCVTDPPNCGSPYGLSIATPTGNTALVTFQSGFNNSGYTLTYTPAGGPTTTLTPTSSPVTLTGLQPLTTYTLTLRGRCGSATTTVLTQTFTTPNPNDEPSTAGVLPLGGSTCTPVQATSRGATATTPNGYSFGGCGQSASTLDVWFAFTTAATGPASIGATVTVGNATPPQAGASPAGEVRVFSSAAGAAGPFTPLACSAGATVQALAPPLVVGNLTPNTTYYVRVTNNSVTNLGAFTICVTDPPNCPAPQNVTTALAGAGTQLVSWTSAGGGGTYMVEFGPTGFMPGTGQMVSGIVGTSTTLTGLTTGAVYQVYVTQSCGSNGNSTRIGPVTFTQAPANDNPCGAVALVLNGSACAPTTGTNLGATTTSTTGAGYFNPGNCGGTAYLPHDVWYTFTTAATGAASTGVALQASGSPAGRLRVFSASSCAGPFTALGCAIGPTVNVVAPPLVLAGLSPATTYYVQVSGYDDADTPGPFTICATVPPACALPTAVQVGSITGTSAQLTFTAPTANTGYLVTYAPTTGGTSVSLNSTGSPVALGPLLSSMAYTVTIQPQCAAGQGLVTTVTFTTASATPANDQCAGAILLTCGQHIIGTAANASTVNDPPSTTVCGFGLIGGPGVFYRFVGTGDSIVVSTCNPGTTYAYEMITFSGSCSNLQCVGGNRPNRSCNGSRPFGNIFGFRSQPGVSYFFFLSQNSITPAEVFELSVQCIQLNCPAPTVVAATQITPTSASVSFQPTTGPNPAGYTVTVTPTAGGASITVQGTTSPIIVNGLRPGIAYTAVVVAQCGSGFSQTSTAVSFATPLASRAAALAAQFSLYPNPARQSVTLGVPAQLSKKPIVLTIYNSVGQCLHTQQLSPATTDTQTTVDLHGLPAGVYLFRFSTAQGVFGKQVIVE